MAERKKPARRGSDEFKRLLASAATHGQRLAFEQRAQQRAESKARFAEPYQPRGPVRRDLKQWDWEDFSCQLPGEVKAWLKETAKAGGLNMGWLVLIELEFFKEHPELLGHAIAWWRRRLRGEAGRSAATQTTTPQSHSAKEAA